MTNIRTRPTAVTAVIEAGGGTLLQAEFGASAKLAISPSMEGFNPLELLNASLAACLVISVKIAARKMELTDRLGDVRVEVTGTKAEEGPSRVARQTCRFHIGGDLTKAEWQALQQEAHALCTVGHTLEHGVEIADGEPLAP